jgi:hypothetical protein
MYEYGPSQRDGRSRDRIPVGRTDPAAHPASITMGTGSLSLGAKRPGRGVNRPPPSSAEVKEKVEL